MILYETSRRWSETPRETSCGKQAPTNSTSGPRQSGSSARTRFASRHQFSFTLSLTCVLAHNLDNAQ
ncbi:hypothetical protein BST61_g1191 [Cercospora zeina]